MAVDTELDVKNASAVYVDRRLIGGSAVLLSSGLLMCLAGATVGGVAVVSACRRYVATLDETPRHIARRRWRQVRSATSAGFGAWQDHARQARPDH